MSTHYKLTSLYALPFSRAVHARKTGWVGGWVGGGLNEEVDLLLPRGTRILHGQQPELLSHRCVRRAGRAGAMLPEPQTIG
jgi:hypothetical protein